ncbi:MAG TPA: 16S rRNA (adenine(1518)-N(6)/adenine(1519)-N(6))-dimethyltransferase RsmA [Candidatus Binataceae bacterium]|nr:16S rRNA (adenine(1518)-N(6)/adenine(1519)-N(6))-dimethyltransferase RsmA [Candidatus Binataceae bacterium]
MSARADSVPDTPTAALQSAGVRPSKARGQNFLVQRAVAEQIVEALEIRADDALIEIGPGLGILTEAIRASAPGKLTLVEIDPRLAARLAMRFAGDRRTAVINRDFLTLEPAELGPGRLKVVGNLPFNVAAAILRRLCDYQAIIERMVLMFQREVAERIRALPGSADYGALSVFTGLYWEIAGHFRVAAGSFYPRPKVEAEVLTFKPRRAAGFGVGEEQQILATVRAAFSAPRKTIRNSLAGGLGLAPQQIEAALRRAAIDPTVRPATLGRAQLIALALALPPLQARRGRDA